MSIKISVGEPEKSSPEKGEPIRLKLNARKSIDGNIIVFDHKDIDIVIIPNKNKIITFPKEEMSDDVYDSQDRLFAFLSKKGIIKRDSVKSGNIYASIQAEYPDAIDINTTQVVLFSVAKWIEDERPGMELEEYYEEELENFFLDPDESESTELGEVPHKEKKGSIDPGIIRRYMTGYGYGQ